MQELYATKYSLEADKQAAAKDMGALSEMILKSVGFELSENLKKGGRRVENSIGYMWWYIYTGKIPMSVFLDHIYGGKTREGK